ncbi:uncharacterized protein K452DRAFT_218712 [Aplosporella prunicola CBS 121167]|uniref:Uncharacterized protein n=1 Tax=Aplosporella prunicola CBS 121167 TaxID=1176127 RepID=A0A6A6BSF2_9PEZI|nr:uncharacterized protein K452DRAFT_218712 [Aplosporella prunicola CBS 121167]KAF2146930.1 hypothetical protein K452DRAFT_218712 [Aplosporella prunicola CBS 121167]
MFKSTGARSLRAFRQAAPLARRSIAQHHAHPAAVRIQPVRFKQPFFTWRRVIHGSIYTAVVLGSIIFVLSPTIEIVDEDEEEGEEYEDEEYEDDSLFIPLGWPKPLPRRFYRGSDPEWQEFRKIAGDSKRHEHIRNTLVMLVRGTVARDQHLAGRFGPIDVTKGRYWLDITFPDGPPQEYARAGIEIGDDYIALARREVDQVSYNRLKRALWPKAVASSAWASTQYLWRVQMNRIREWVGLSPKTDPKTDLLEKQLEAMARAQQLAASRSNSNNNNPGANPMPNNPASSERTVAAPTTKDNTPSSAPSSASSKANSSNPTTPAEKNAGLPDFTPIPPPSIALTIFSATLAKNWKPMALEAPRGTVIVSGLIEVQGAKARCTMDVVGAYDPVQDRYVVLRGGFRRVQDKQQRPKGGR